MIREDELTGKKWIEVLPNEGEKEVVQQMCLLALENNDGNIQRAAIDLKINRTTLHERLKKWGLADEQTVQPKQD
jgi:transcriptional regulator of acetoin/glycerol metabolism